MNTGNMSNDEANVISNFIEQMENTKRYSCGSGEGMFESEDGNYIEYASLRFLKEDILKLLISLGITLTQIENSHRDGYYTQIIYINEAKNKIEKFQNQLNIQIEEDFIFDRI